MEQKFKRGDLVHIAKDLGESMSHFTADKDAVIIGSYADQFGGSNIKSYTIMFLDTGDECSWYDEHQLTFLRNEDERFIRKIKKTRDERESVESNLGWIVENWKDIRTKVPGASTIKLMSLVGITEPGGKHGEGIDWYNHALYTIRLLDEVLLTGNLAKVEEFIADLVKADGFIVSSDLCKD